MIGIRSNGHSQGFVEFVERSSRCQQKNCSQFSLCKAIRLKFSPKNGVHHISTKWFENISCKLFRCCSRNDKITADIFKGTSESLFSVSSEILHLNAGGVDAFIPHRNASGHETSDFCLKIINNCKYRPNLKPSQKICSNVVYCEPHGARFSLQEPAVLVLPLICNVSDINSISCLSSDSDIEEIPVWKPMNPEDFTICNKHITICTTHFSFFTAIVNKHYPEAAKMIYADVGGTLEVPKVPGVKVIFPATAIKYDIMATIKVMYADGPYDVDHEDPGSFALAAPVVKLGPAGHKFNEDSIESVELQLPLPNGKEIVENFGRTHLTIWQSTTAEHNDLEWECLHSKYRIIEDEDDRLCVRFPVSHFTFFRVLWNILDSALHEAKIGASHFYPNFEFCISFQAFMSATDCDETFGLCCLCFKSGATDQNVGNFPIFVGSSGLRMVKSGLLQIRIVSNLFEANKDFGEEALVQREFFNGRQFDKQFACKFKQPRRSRQNTIGKIFVERVLDDSTIELMFDFVLTMPTNEDTAIRETDGKRSLARANHVTHGSNWEAQLSQELANVLSIKTEQDLGDDIWKDVALGLGYTELEIDLKFKDQEEPIAKLLNDFKKRGGNANDFISAMYKVGRGRNLENFRNRCLSSGSENEIEDDMRGFAGSNSPSGTSSSSGVVLPPARHGDRKRRLPQFPDGPIPTDKLDELAAHLVNQWRYLGRALNLDEEVITAIDKSYPEAREKAYQMLVTWQEKFPENNFEILHQALGKINLNRVARKLYELVSE